MSYFVYTVKNDVISGYLVKERCKGDMSVVYCNVLELVDNFVS